MARRGKARRTAQQWSEILERWKASGLRAQEFGEQHGIKAKTLWWWKWKLDSCMSDGPRTGKASEDAPRFLPIRVVDRAEAPLTAAPVCGAPIEIIIDERRTVRVGPSFDEDTLRRVLAVLRSVEVV